jgi:DNA-binding NtrC family response regulator
LPLVIEGELGTGRRALAEAIHDWSPCAGAPLVALEPAELESAGRTGSGQRLDEVMSAALDGSVVIVDPVDLPDAIQQELLGAMRRYEEKGPRWLTIARQPLEQASQEGRLLLELQYRLDAARLPLPSLRDRTRDQQTICQGIALRVAREMGESAPVVDDEMVKLLARDGFPGNRLGIESRLRSCMVRSDGNAGRVADLLGEDFGRSRDRSRDRSEPMASLHLKTLERDTIIRALAHWQGNRTRASETLGISVRTLRNKIRDYGLR